MKNEKLKMKNYWRVVLLSTFLPFYLSTFLPASQLKDITVKSEATKDMITVVVSSKTKFNIFRVEKPNRLVIDLTDCETAKNDFPQKTQFISNIRTAQYKDKPVKKAYLFGSYSRDSAEENSDIDILVELDYSQSIGLKFVRMQLDLQEILQTKVDLLSEKAVSKYIRPYIDNEKELIYEK